MEPKTFKKLLLSVGSVICIIVIIWGALGIYQKDLPLFMILLIAGVVIIVVANKVKMNKPGEDPEGLILPEKWKCSCESYNDNSSSICPTCGHAKISG